MNVLVKRRGEQELVARLLDALHYTEVTLKESDRPDVLAHIAGSQVGIEVTQFHADEQTGVKGSPLRRIEERLAQKSLGRPYSMWGVANPNFALVTRIKEKVALAATYDASHYSEMWLLISTGIPKAGAIGSTFAVPAFVNIDDLNASTHELLSDSVFSVVYLHMHLPRALYRWSHVARWHAIHQREG